MPIECNIFTNGGNVDRQEPIEPDHYNTYRYKSGWFGKVILAGCYKEDNGGRVYIFTEETLERLVEDDGHLGDEVEQLEYEIIPSGASIPITINLDSGAKDTFVFTHHSMN